MKHDLEKRLAALESKGCRRIETWTDYVKWCYEGCPKPVEWEPKLLAFIEEETRKINGLGGKKNEYQQYAETHRNTRSQKL
jgi:hypothetical protein